LLPLVPIDQPKSRKTRRLQQAHMPAAALTFVFRLMPTICCTAKEIDQSHKKKTSYFKNVFCRIDVCVPLVLLLPLALIPAVHEPDEDQGGG
jgi:hypothetical protein